MPTAGRGAGPMKDNATYSCSATLEFRHRSADEDELFFCLGLDGHSGPHEFQVGEDDHERLFVSLKSSETIAARGYSVQWSET